MDKFGIFKLLGSFLESYKALGENSNADLQKKDNPLSKILSSFTQKPNPAPTPTPAQAVPLPLQSGMINTMKSHDEFVKRVIQKPRQ